MEFWKKSVHGKAGESPKMLAVCSTHILHCFVTSMTQTNLDSEPIPKPCHMEFRTELIPKNFWHSIPNRTELQKAIPQTSIRKYKQLIWQAETWNYWCFWEADRPLFSTPTLKIFRTFAVWKSSSNCFTVLSVFKITLLTSKSCSTILA